MEFDREYNDYIEPIKRNSYYFDDLEAIRRRANELVGVNDPEPGALSWIITTIFYVVLASVLKIRQEIIRAWWFGIVALIVFVLIFLMTLYLVDRFITEPKRKKAERIFNLGKESIVKKRIKEHCDRELNDLRNQFENSTNEHVGLLYDHIWSDHSGNEISADDVTFNIKQYHNLRDDYHRISHDIRRYISQQKEILQKYKYFEERLLVDIYCDPDIAKKFEYR